MPEPATKRDTRSRHAAETRGTVTLLRGEDEEEIAAGARGIGRAFGIEPQLDRAPAEGLRVGCRPAGGEGQPPATKALADQGTTGRFPRPRLAFVPRTRL